MEYTRAKTDVIFTVHQGISSKQTSWLNTIEILRSSLWPVLHRFSCSKNEAFFSKLPWHEDDNIEQSQLLIISESTTDTSIVRSHPDQKNMTHRRHRYLTDLYLYLVFTHCSSVKVTSFNRFIEENTNKLL